MDSVRIFFGNLPSLPFVEKKGLLPLGLAVGALAAVGALYIRREREVFCFDTWKTTFGVTHRRAFTRVETASENLEQLAAKYSPQELLEKLYTYVTTQDLGAIPPAPQEPLEWVKWLSNNVRNQAELQKITRTIQWGYEANPRRSEEEEKALFVQNWVAIVQKWVGMVNGGTRDFIDALASSPRLAYTVLFNFSAPFVAEKIWDGVKEHLPDPFHYLGNVYVEHKGKIAFAAFALVALLYQLVKQEQGGITNLTRQWEALRGSHRGCDLIPTYGDFMHMVLMRIGRSKPGEAGSNIIIRFHEDTHGTFGGLVGANIAEMSATGRIYDRHRDTRTFPQLKDLQVWELDVEAFAAEYREPEQIHRAWRDLMANVAREKNVIIAFKQFAFLHETFIKKDEETTGYGGRRRRRENYALETTFGILGSLISVSLRQGQFRCILEMDQDDEKKFKQNPELSNLFTSFASPTIPPEELKSFLGEIYSASGIIPKVEMEAWLTRLKPALEAVPRHPQILMECVEEAVQATEDAIREKTLQGSNFEATKETWRKNCLRVDVIAQRLHELKQIKAKLIQRLWIQKRQGKIESPTLQLHLALVDKVVKPLFERQLAEAKKTLNEGQETHYLDAMIRTVQRRFEKVIGGCTRQEWQRLQKLPEKLKDKVKGQNIAVSAVCKAVEDWRLAPALNGKALVLFFAGPTGVGKSELATQLAFHLNEIFGLTDECTPKDEHNVLRVQLAPAGQDPMKGWEGTRKAILHQIQKHPASVIILEEWDKMPDNMKGNLNEFFETHALYLIDEYSQEKTFVDLSSTVFIMTSNVAEQELKDTLDVSVPGLLAKAQALILAGIKKIYDQQGTSAFASRVKEFLIPFFGLKKNTIQEIVEKHLNTYVENGTIPAAAMSELGSDLRAMVNPAEGHVDVRAIEEKIRERVGNYNRRRFQANV